TGDLGPFGLRRAALLAEGGGRYPLANGLELSAGLGAGLRAVLRWQRGQVTSGDLTAPAIAGDLRAADPLASAFALFLDVRGEVDWVSVNGKRQAFFEPSASLGVAARL